jgi:large subunit ribosomal protein L13
MLIDAKNLIVGRMATYVAKQALLGEKIDIINCEKAVMSGKKKFTFNKYLNLKDRGTHKGPFLPKRPERFVRRAIRGMIPYKKERGRVAYQNIKCYLGVPEDFKDKKTEKIANAEVSKLPNLNYVSVLEICKRVGAKIE